MKQVYFEVKANFEVVLTKRFAISKASMVKITKRILWDILKAHKNDDCNVVIEDSTNKRFWFTACKLPSGFYDFYISCCLTDSELTEMGIYNGVCNDTEYTTSLYVCYLNGQHRELDYQYSDYEFNEY